MVEGELGLREVIVCFEVLGVEGEGVQGVIEGLVGERRGEAEAGDGAVGEEVGLAGILLDGVGVGLFGLGVVGCCEMAGILC